MSFSLVKQLFIVSLCTLLLPWTGCQYIREMETLIRQQQSNTLLAFTKPLAENIKEQALFQQKIQQLNRQQPPFFAPHAYSPIIIDGYSDEWITFYQQPLLNMQNSNGAHQYQATIYQEDLYLFVRIADQDITYYNPTRPAMKNNDWLRITTADIEYRIFTAAPGNTQTFRHDQDKRQSISDNRILGNWQEYDHGYQVELKIPLALVKQGIRLEALSEQQQKPRDKQNPVIAANITNGLAPILIPSPGLAEWLTPYTENAWDLQIVDEQGWPLVDYGNQATKNRPQRPVVTRDNIDALLLNRIYRFFLAAILPVRFSHQWPLPTTKLSALSERIPIETLIANPSGASGVINRWYSLAESNQSALLVIQPIYQNGNTLGYVVATQTEQAWLSFTNDAMRRVINLSLLSFALLVLVLLGYAVLLSVRIKKLQQKTEQAILPDGTIVPFAPSPLGDEIGALSQSYTGLLNRVKNYNDYLQSLTHKLAHEIRTPLAIVKSSLEMLATVPADEQQPYIERALQGNQRLANILNAMSESTQVEQLVQHAEFKSQDIKQLLEELTQAYQTTYPSFQFTFNGPTAPCIANSNPELFAQLIDKLVDNARDFTPAGESIRISLTKTHHEWLVRVCNPGSQLPEAMAEQLFDSLISVRDQKREKTHLGLGLYIVRLIAQAHQGRARAFNLPDNAGVCFEVGIPAPPAIKG